MRVVQLKLREYINRCVERERERGTESVAEFQGGREKVDFQTRGEDYVAGI